MDTRYLWQLGLVGLGGFVGSSLRFALAGLVHRLAPAALFPLGTLAVNAAGCLAIGFLGGLMELRQMLGPEARLFVLIGLLGGFTTFSTFAWETLALANDSQLLRALVNILAQVALGLVAAWLGYAAARAL